MGKGSKNKASTPERELQELISYQSKLAKRGRELPVQEKARLEEILRMIAAKVTETFDVKAIEKRETTEQEKIDAALKEGQRRGWIELHDMGDPSAEKHCVLMGSSHYSHPSVDISKIPESIKQAQFQMFAQLYLFQKHGVQLPLLVEGYAQGAMIDPKVMIQFPGGRSVPVRSKEAQEHFIKNSMDFMQLQHDMRRDGKHSIFYDLSGYSHIQGAHAPDVNNTLNRVYDLQLNEKRFDDKYKPKNGTNVTITAEMHHGRWWIFINNQWVQPEILLQDCKDCLQFLDELAEFNLVREREVVNHFEKAVPSHLPMSWTGLGHVQPIIEMCLARGMAVRRVIPIADRNTKVPPHSGETALAIKCFAEKYVLANTVLT